MRSADRSCFRRITGRTDDVLNVSGHRLGTMEIESALVSCTHLVAEALKIAQELRNWVAKEIGLIAKSKDIRFGDNLPKSTSIAASDGSL